MIGFSQRLAHKTKHPVKVFPCIICTRDGISIDSRDNVQRSKDYLFKYESRVIQKSYNKKQLNKYFLKDGIYYHQGRFTIDNPFRFKDLDQVPFIDAHIITGPTPVMLCDSPILYAMIINIHCKLIPHAGIELTVKEVLKEVMVHEGLRRVVKRIKKDCTLCRIMEKKTMEVEMASHPRARTIIAPPFYSSMIDIAFGFKGQPFKRSRSSVKVYALICVCLVTGATSIMAMEGLETQDVVSALERHASRHGIPKDIYVDNGTQLLALKDVRFSIRDINARLYDSVGMRVHESIAKSHEERGRVERRIRAIRETLEKLGVQTSTPLSTLQWETLFAKIASMLDDLPLARGDKSNVTNLGYDILTANRLKLGRNNNRALEGPGFTIDNTATPYDILERNREIYQTWYQLFIDNINMLTVKPNKWNENSPLPEVDDVVLFTFNDSGYGATTKVWKLGTVVSVSPRKLGISYVSRLSKTRVPTMGTISRNPRDVSIVYSCKDLFINTNDHYNALQQDQDGN